MAQFRAPFVRGQVICDKYEVHELVGVGGVAFVMSAVHLELNHRVALKFLRPEVLSNQDALRLFAEEARIAVKIKSPHVARIFDVGRLPQGTPFIAMELLIGENLGQHLCAHGRLPIESVTSYALQACEALAAAHAAGAIHRDIKPENLFLARQNPGPDVLKVLDFGISKTFIHVKAPGRIPTITRTLISRGSPLYMSPEQMRSAQKVDLRTDVWSLGSVMYELLCGVNPFAAPSLMQVCALVLEKEPSPLSVHLPDVPPALEAVVMRCLEKDPQLRFQNMAELALALLPFAPSGKRPLVERCVELLATDDPELLRAMRNPPSVDDAPEAHVSVDVDVRSPEPQPVPVADEQGQEVSINRPVSDPAPARRSKSLSLTAAGIAALAVLVATFSVRDAARKRDTAEHAAKEPVAVATRPDPKPEPAPPTPPVPAAEPRASLSAPPPTSPIALPPNTEHATHVRTTHSIAHPTRSAAASSAVSTTQKPDPAPESEPALAPPPLAAADEQVVKGVPVGKEASEQQPVPAAVVGGGVQLTTEPVLPAAVAPPPPAPPRPSAERSGKLSPKAITAAIRAHANQVEGCFERAQMDHPDLHGRMLFRAHIDGHGKVVQAWSGNRLANGQWLFACILSAAKDWKFPAPAGGAPGDVSYTFVFE